MFQISIDRIHLFIADTQYEVTSSFLRAAEFIESPLPGIKGNYFSLEKFMDAYAKRYGNFTYTSDWSGFNIPGDKLWKFLNIFEYDLLVKERFLLDFRQEPDTNFHIIATYNDVVDDVVEHEFAHAFWYIDKEGYQEHMWKLMLEFGGADSSTLELWQYLHDKIKNMGYHNSVIDDEIQAYLATNKHRKYWEDTFGRYDEFEPWIEKFRLYFLEYAREKGYDINALIGGY